MTFFKKKVNDEQIPSERNGKSKLGLFLCSVQQYIETERAWMRFFKQLESFGECMCKASLQEYLLISFSTFFDIIL
jgi:hypothetical protein